MKFHWGHGIALFICIFLISMGIFVYMSYHNKFNLVEKEYYEDGLVYQKKIQAEKNAAGLADKFTIVQDSVTIHIVYPSLMKGKSLSGNILFYRPSNDQLDRKFAMTPDPDGKQSISYSGFIKGKYQVKFDWKMENKEYFQEENLFFN